MKPYILIFTDKKAADFVRSQNPPPFQTRSRPWCLTGYSLLNSYFDLTNQGSVCSKYVTIKFPCKKDFSFSLYSYIFI